MAEPNDSDRAVIRTIVWAQKENASAFAGVEVLAQYRELCERAARADERAKVLAEIEQEAKKMIEKPKGMHTNGGKEQAPPSFSFWVSELIRRLQ